MMRISHTNKQTKKKHSEKVLGYLSVKLYFKNHTSKIIPRLLNHNLSPAIHPTGTSVLYMLTEL